MIRLTLFFCALCVTALFAASNVFTAKELTELKTLPMEQSTTVQMIKKGELLTVQSAVTDTSGLQWYLIRIISGSIQGFVPAKAVEFFGAEDTVSGFLRSTIAREEERKQRVAKLREHPDWPRRIMQAVRKAAICLKMDREQLLLSWNEPYQKTKGFILGFGDVEIYFYRQADPIAVILKNDEIVGWSEKSK